MSDRTYSEGVDHPSHYGGKDNVYEAIKVIEAWGLNFNLGSVLKYVSRAGKKPGEELLKDLEKAEWYVRREIERLSREVRASEDEKHGAVREENQKVIDRLDDQIAERRAEETMHAAAVDEVKKPESVRAMEAAALREEERAKTEDMCEVEHGDWSGPHRRTPSCPRRGTGL